MDEVVQALYSQTAGLLAHHETDGIHEV